MNEHQLIEKMRWLFKLKKHTLAIELFKDNPRLLDNSTALFLAGRSHMRLGKKEEALSLFHLALKIRPDYSSVKLEIAKIHSRENPKESIRLIKECLAHNPEEPAYWGVLGTVHFGMDDYAKAADAFDKYLTLDPNDHRTMTNLAACKDNLGKPKEARELYERAIATRPDYMYAHLNLAVHLSDARQLDEAEAGYLTALQIDPNCVTGVYGLACVYALQGKTDKALDYLKDSCERDSYYKAYARADVDFEGLLENPRFLEITSP